MFHRLVLLLSLLSIDPSLVAAQSLQSDEDAMFGEAEQKAARLAFKQGRSAFEQGRFADALDHFEHAYALSGRSELLFNVGLCADRIRDDERALEAFEQYLAATPESEHREQVQMRVIALRDAQARRKDSERSDKAGASETHGGKRREEGYARRAPTPAEVAAASAHDGERSPLSSGTRRPVDDEGSVLESFWFWAGASVLLIAGGVTAYVVLQPDEQAELPKPNTQLTVQTLRVAP